MPGTIAGLLAAHERLGRLPRDEVMRPAIEAATDGFEADAYYALTALDNLDVLRSHPTAAAIYLDDRGLPPTPGLPRRRDARVPPLIRQPELARTLEVVAERGAAGFYEGEIAEAIEHHFAARGGLIDRDDLAAYEPIVGEPLHMTYRGHDLFAPSSPCGAWTELQILRILERFDMNGDDALHAIAAASRHAFADRYRDLGDGATPLQDDPDATARAIRGGDIGPVADGKPWEVLAFDRHGTTHFAVVDGDGMMVSCTHTAGNAFGSKIVAEGTGLLFDAGMVWFNAHPGAVNSIVPAIARWSTWARCSWRATASRGSRSERPAGGGSSTRSSRSSSTSSTAGWGSRTRSGPRGSTPRARPCWRPSGSGPPSTRCASAATTSSRSASSTRRSRTSSRDPWGPRSPRAGCRRASAILHPGLRRARGTLA